MEDCLLNAKNLQIKYATNKGYFTAVSGVEFSIRPNEVFGIVGESGSGKSTLVNGLLRLLPATAVTTADEISFLGQDMLRVSGEALRKLRWEKISYIPQGAMNILNPVMTIRAHFKDTIWDHEGRCKRQDLEERVNAALDRVNLKHSVADCYPHELSGGMKQRVCIAMSTLLNPALIIADEPTSALDVISQRTVIQILAEVRTEMAASMIMIGHDMALQAQISDRMGIMFNGYFVELGTVADIFNNPIHPYTKGLIQAIPSIRKKQDISALASCELTEEQRRSFASPRPLVEISPGHFVADCSC